MCRTDVNGFTIRGVDASYASRQLLLMMDKKQLLDTLKAKGARNVDIARVLGLPDSRIPEIYRSVSDETIAPGQKTRDLSYDEGVKLIREFELEIDRPVAPLPASVYRLAVRHIAGAAGLSLADKRLAELAEDLRAFSSFVADPKVRQSIDAAEGFFRALQTRRPAPAEGAPSESDPERNH